MRQHHFTLLFLAMLGCGQATVPAPIRPSVAPSDPHRSRDGIVRATFAALAANDADALAALVDIRDLNLRAVDCGPAGLKPVFSDDIERTRERVKLAAAEAKGLAFDVVEVSPPVEPVQLSTAGTSLEPDGCKLKLDVETQHVLATIRARSGGDEPLKLQVKVQLMLVGGRWHLSDPPTQLAASVAFLQQLTRVAQQTCSCRDAACVMSAADDAVSAFRQRAEADPDASSLVHDTSLLRAIANKFNTCAARIWAATSPGVEQPPVINVEQVGQ